MANAGLAYDLAEDMLKEKLKRKNGN